MVIKIFTANNKIFDLESVVADLSEIMQKQDSFEISMCSEGPCLEHIKLYQLLDYLCDRHNFDKRLIGIHTSNLCESHPEYQIIKDFNYWELEKSRENIKNITPLPKTFDDNFLHFGHFIGHGNIDRLMIASHLFTYHRSRTLQTYHYEPGSSYHREFMGVEDMMYYKKSKKIVLDAIDFLYQCPLKLDPVDAYPILQPANISIGSYYHRFMVEIVNQSFYTGKIFYLDEKIWRPMLLKTPFMVQGSKNFIKNLHKLGFKTFEKYWDESYSKDFDGVHAECIIGNINNFAKHSISDLRDMYLDMQETLEHNFNLVLSLTRSDVESLVFDS